MISVNGEGGQDEVCNEEEYDEYTRLKWTQLSKQERRRESSKLQIQLRASVEGTRGSQAIEQDLARALQLITAQCRPSEMIDSAKTMELRTRKLNERKAKVAGEKERSREGAVERHRQMEEMDMAGEVRS